MTDHEFLCYASSGRPIESGSEMHKVMHRLSQRALRLTTEINTVYHEPEELRALMSELIGKAVGSGFGLFPPFYTDCGLNISIGRDTFINMGCAFQDWGGIRIGDNCLIGHNCTICTVNHEKEEYHRGDMVCRSVTIGDRVWVGANVTILPGVTIGDGAIVGAGSIVTKDVKPGTTVVGAPAKELKSKSNE